MRKICPLSFILLLTFCGLGNQLVRADATPTDDDVTTVAGDNNDFAIDLYGHLDTESGNLFFSPYSISSALAMTYNGAEGATATQMAQALHFSLGLKRTNAAYASLSDALDSGGTVNGSQVYQLSVANALWGQSGLAYNSQFLQTLDQDYGAPLQQTDFIDNSAQATDDINQWVANHTGDKIQNLFPPGDITNKTRLVLVNAIYFQGNWASGFDGSLTHDASFHLDKQNDVTVSMMHQEETLGYMENADVQVAEFPYAGNNLSMVVLLPRKIDGLDNLEGKLTADRLTRWLDKLSSQEVIVHLPKFQVTSQFELKPVLKALGMSDAFSLGADFSGITTSQGLYITHVVHKAYVDVNEAGTQAAAATGVGFGAEILLGPPSPPVAFRVDHPFLFLIRDNASGAILFIGRVTNPNDQ